ncbi:MAG: hypothetical protein WD066_18225 [Planctomycetaceae bacterium]
MQCSKKLMQVKWLAALAIVAVFAGCNRGTTETAPDRTDASESNADRAEFVLADEPDGANDVIAARESSSDGDDVVVVGRIGGSENPWVEGRAAFSIVDRSLQACSDIPGDACSMPWDYCCETDKLPKATALVKFVDADGQLVKSDARELLGLKELQTVVVRGKSHRDESGNLTVLANGVFVRE